jgi:hypothetical protein
MYSKKQEAEMMSVGVMLVKSFIAGINGKIMNRLQVF